MPPVSRNKRRSSSNNNALRPLQKAYARFLKIRGTPREIALGFALGLFVGMSPLMGLHTAIAVFLAACFKWNKISSAVSVWITNAFTAPIIYPITYYFGALILGTNEGLRVPQGLSFTELFHVVLKAPAIFWALTVGGVVTGIPLAFAGYYVCFYIFRRYQEQVRRKIALAKEKVAQKKKRRQMRRQAKPDEPIPPQAIALKKDSDSGEPSLRP